MKTENLNITPENGREDNKSEKTSNVKRNIGKAAAFAGAAGLGAAGAMAANAMDSNVKEEKVSSSSNEKPTDNIVAEEPVAEPEPLRPEPIDPNDIMIIDGDDVVLDENGDEGDTMLDDELQPIIGEQIIEPTDEVAMIDVDDDIFVPDDGIEDNSMEIIDEMYPGSDDFEPYDETDILLADNEPDSCEPDILNDILDA